MIGSTEFERSKDQLVIPVADFDNRLKTDLELRGKIAGFSSVALYHIARGIIGKGYSLPAFSKDYFGRPIAYIGLHPDVYREVFGEDSPYDNFEDIMVENRIYGMGGAVVEYIMGQPYVPRKSNIASLTSGISDLIAMMVDKTRLMRESELRNKKLPTFFGSPERDAETLHQIYKIIPNKEALVDALTALRERSGVQIIFGYKEQFVDFLKRFKAKPEDDCAASVHTAVPAHLVLAVVPLGKYEREKLMGRT